MRPVWQTENFEWWMHERLSLGGSRRIRPGNPPRRGPGGQGFLSNAPAPENRSPIFSSSTRSRFAEARDNDTSYTTRHDTTYEELE